MDGFVKNSNSRRTKLVNTRRTSCGLNGRGMLYNTDFGFFTKPSKKT